MILKKTLVIMTLAISANSSALHVVIDPGHGGIDVGASRGHIRESDISLKVSQALKEILSQQSDIQVSMTRDKDQTLSLGDRVAFADSKKADLMVSIHTNASQDPKARGVEFYFQNHLPADEDTLFLAANENNMKQGASTLDSNELESEPTKKNDVLSIVEDLKRQQRMKASLRLGQNLKRSWQQAFKADSHSLRQAPFYVVSKANVPSVLVELGFISNPKEAEKLTNPEMQKQIAARLAQGIQQYKEIVDKVNSVP